MTRTIFLVIKQGGEDFAAKPAARPTRARPGDKAKLRVMMGRIERGEEIFHPDDPTCFPEIMWGRSYADMEFPTGGIRMREIWD